jgi:glycosyltransferase involved in cell wall biosynthesis
MRVAMVFPGLPRRPGGAFLAAISQARAIGHAHDLHAIVLGEPETALLADLRRQVPGEVHSVRGARGTVGRHIRGFLRDIRADVVQVESLAGAEWISDPRLLHPGTVFRAYDATFAVAYSSIQSPTNMPVTPLGSALKLLGLRRSVLIIANTMARRREVALARRFDRVLCFSDKDRDAFQSQGVAAGVVPLPMETSPEPHRPSASRVLRIAFVASFSYFPNVDALDYLLNSILPSLPTGLDWRLEVVGGEPPVFAKALLHKGRVRLHGYVDDLASLLNSTDVFVVPLRFGGGVKLKTMTAMARGIPVVTTEAGCTGLSVQDGEHLLIRDTPAGFVEALRTLAANPSLRQKLGDAGRGLIARAHAPSVVTRALELEYEAAITSRSRR